MPDVLVAVIIAALAGERMFAEWLHAKERRYLVNAAIADTPGELRQLEQKPERRFRARPVPLPEGYEGQVGL